jgi:hypothetical protein
MEKAFQAIVQVYDNAVAVLTAPQFVPMSERIAAFGLKHRLAAIAGLDGFVQLGGWSLRPQRVRRLARREHPDDLVSALPRDRPAEFPRRWELFADILKVGVAGLINIAITISRSCC